MDREAYLGKNIGLLQEPELKRQSMEWKLVKKVMLTSENHRMCDVYREPCFNQKMFTYGLNMGLAWDRKAVYGMKTLTLH